MEVKLNMAMLFSCFWKSTIYFKAERLVLNSMQRMSAIATKTKGYVDLLQGTKTKIWIPEKQLQDLGMRKWAVKIGGGETIDLRFMI
jgi:nicotinate-nucleotide pyrophosphorylase (carboxylating)